MGSVAPMPISHQGSTKPTRMMRTTRARPARTTAVPTPAARSLARERDVDLSEIAGTGPEGAVRVPDVEQYLESLETAEPAVEGDLPITPVAARIADELGVDVQRVQGTGPGGRITKRDLRQHLEAGEDEEEKRELYGDEIKLSQKRKALIRNMVKSKAEVPHFYISMDVDVEPLRVLRERLKQDGESITYTHLILKACAVALENFPDVNATFRDDRIVRYQPVNVAVAVDVQGELVAPVVKDCQGRNVRELAEEADALVARAREKKLQPEDYADGTFTISNLGMLGVDHFYAIITPPQSTVLSVSAMRRVAVVDGDQIRIGYRMDFGLGCDHRVLDGAKAAAGRAAPPPGDLEVEWLGRVPYGEALALQQERVADRRAGGRGDALLLLEHPPVVTLGRSARPEHLLASREALAARGVEVHEVARGGDVTWHGPGQLVGYLVLDLAARGEPDVHAHLRRIEAILIDALGRAGVPAGRRPGMTGVFAADRAGADGPPRKIASIGVGLRGWVTYHGFALNVSCGPEDFADIVPCGLHGVTMTSLARELRAPGDGAALLGRARALVADAARRRLARGPTIG